MKGILFKPDMIKAIVEGRKTVTRRAIKLPHTCDSVRNGINVWVAYEAIGVYQEYIKPRYQVGETVYIKETLYRHPYLNEAGYMLDQTPVFINQTIGDCLKWRWQKDILTGMFMPQEAARYFIKITGVRAEEIQEITDNDAKAEGVARPPNYSLTPHYKVWFQYLWDKINKDYPFESNPWVFRYEFSQSIRERECYTTNHSI